MLSADGIVAVLCVKSVGGPLVASGGVAGNKKRERAGYITVGGSRREVRGYAAK